MFIVLSADAVASNVISGENLRDVIPRAWARGIVTSGMKFKDLEEMAGVGETDGGFASSTEEAYDLNLDLDRDLESDRGLVRDCLGSA